MIQRIDFFLSLFALALLAAVVSGCTPAQVPPTPTPEGTMLRVTNQSEYDLENLVVRFPDSRIEFGGVPAGVTTEYAAAPGGVYNYAAYEFDVDGETVSQPVIDWVGESPRPGSRFTYVIDYHPDQPQMMQIELIEVVED